MKIRNVSIEKMGRFKENKVVKFNENISVICGNNESGKSTIYNALKFIFFGIKPVDRDNNKFVPWGESYIHISAKIKRTNEEFEIKRTLKSKAKGEICDENDKVDSIGNKTLPFINKISMELFESLFHLKSEDLIKLEKKSWEEVQEDIVFTYGEYLKKPSEVITNIDKELSKIWKENQRGKFEIRNIENHIVDLNKELRIYNNKIDEVVELERELDLMSIELYENEKKIIKLENDIERQNKYSSIKKQIDIIENLESEIIRLDKYDTSIDPLLMSSKEKNSLEVFMKNARERQKEIDDIEESIDKSIFNLFGVNYDNEDVLKININEIKSLRISWNKKDEYEDEKTKSRILIVSCLILLLLIMSTSILNFKWANIIINIITLTVLLLAGAYNYKRLKKMENNNVESYKLDMKNVFGKIAYKSFMAEDEFIYKIENIKEKILNLENLKKSREKLFNTIRNLNSVIDSNNIKLKRIGNGNLKKGEILYEELLKLRNRKNSLINELELDRNDLSNMDLSDITDSRKREYMLLLKENRNRKEDCKIRINSIKESISYKKNENRYFTIKSDLEQSYDKLNNLKENRNQLLILQKIVEISDKRYKEKNQPDIIKNASKYIKKMTKGKYSDLRLIEEGDKSILALKYKGEIIKIGDNLSQGTINQIYLSFRLAIIEKIDCGESKLPLIFDEAFINWDSGRLKETLELLKEISDKRQVIIFTCHPELFRKNELDSYFINI